MADIQRPSNEDESFADIRVRELLESYVALSRATLLPIGPNLFQLTVPSADRAAFARRSVIRLAFSIEAFQEDSRAEMAIIGSGFVDQLIDAIRLHGARQFFGRLMPSHAEDMTALPLPIPVRSGRATTQDVRMARHRLGSLTARIVVRAGASVEEHLAESAPFDLCSGLVVTPDIANVCSAQSFSGKEEVAPPREWAELECISLAPMKALVASMVADIERRFHSRTDAIAATAAHDLSLELARIDRYYTSLLDNVGGRRTDIIDAESRATFRAEHDRRAREERERHLVRVTVYPIQLKEWEVSVQRVEWNIESATGHRGKFAGQRLLAGESRWSLGCPVCRTALPATLAVCIHDHIGCDACTAECSVCGGSFCRDHGTKCHIDSQATCGAHARSCLSCDRVHCSSHEGVCDESAHAACSSCLAPCAHCGRVICNKHARRTRPDAPLGERRLCGTCARTCEGGTGEIVGPDEVTDCASCDRVVCRNHQARCAVDGAVHCSRHLRRTDRSRRLVCDKDRAACALEPNAVLAWDEVFRCETCGLTVCDHHTDECVVDRKRHCTRHLQRVGDHPTGSACDSHRSTCYIDGAQFTLNGTTQCPSCGRLACKAHLSACGNCGRRVCANDFKNSGDTCATCSKLADAADPSDEVLSAAIGLRGHEAQQPKRWRIARDARHLVVELDLGWTRRLVFSVPHGQCDAETAMSHSIFGSRKLRG